jgi:predicted ATPase/DNA-binding winged helix-turn-helix (wHTH) protein
MRFGRFSLLEHRRELLCDGISVSIGGRAMDVLIALTEHQGELVTKDDLLSRVWPTTVVEENALQFQISQIRKALGKDRDLIKTISGRGYRFVGEFAEPERCDAGTTDASAPAVRQHFGSPSATNLPAPTSDLIGREAQLREIADLAASYRLITLTGAGGIGKTRLSIELGRRLMPEFADGVWLIELGALSDPALVLPTIAAALGLPGGQLSIDRLAAALGEGERLLVLDNCEHVIEAAARVAEALLRICASLKIVASSREPLRVDGECVYRVPALDMPAANSGDAERALRYSAINLFVARARTADPSYSLDPRTTEAVVEICRRVDGVPLAIELAAARAATLGVEELAARIDDCLSLLTDGRRTAPTRHRTLRASFDWSYELLSEPERAVLRRVAVFVANFTLPAVRAVAGNLADLGCEITNHVHALVARSFLEADLRGTVPQYRLKETTRAYAREKLRETGELTVAARRHAVYFRDLLEQAGIEQEMRPMAERLAAYSATIDDVGVALEWAFSPDGDAEVGTALRAASEHHWFGLTDTWCRRADGTFVESRSLLGAGTRRGIQVATTRDESLPQRKTGSLRLVQP